MTPVRPFDNVDGMQRILVLSTCFALACVGDSGPATTFVGTWSCDITQTLTIGGNPQPSSTVTDTVIISSPGAGQLLIDDQTGQGDCVINASYSGATAAVTGGTCTQVYQADTATLTYDGGNLILGSGTISGNAKVAFSGMVSGQSVVGTLDATFVCTSP